MPARRLQLALFGAALAASALPAQSARAFCGFFVSGADAELTNNASQVVLMRKGSHTVLTMSNNYKGPPEDFAMVVPVPVVLQKEQVKTLSPDVFKHIDQLSAPRLVEYWEQDPCYQPPPMPTMARRSAMAPMAAPAPSGAAAPADYGVKIEAKFTVGEYEILILSAKESNGLETWLRLSKYNIPKGAAEALAPYIREQQKFFVAKVDIKKVQRDAKGTVVLSPLRFGYDAQELRLPVRLGLLNAPSGGDKAAKQDLIVYLLSPDTRFEVANYRNVFIPTNIEVSNDVRKAFPSFYAELFDETVVRNNNKVVVTEYAWQTTSCDPCPTPPLQQNDLYTLGDEQIFPELAQLQPQPIAPASSPRVTPGPSGPPASSPAMRTPPTRRPMPPGGFFGSFSPWTLTRLHTRYDKASLSEDLIFRGAEPVLGGRATWDGGLGDHGAQVQQGGVNNFQARYIIRHYWEGPVACKNPIYGRWGGPPSSGFNPGGKGAVEPAADLANAPRGQVSLPKVVVSGLPELGIAPKTRAKRPGEK
jgi:hypothetical protein